jgi:hypothetical protein
MQQHVVVAVMSMPCLFMLARALSKVSGSHPSDAGQGMAYQN